MVLIEFRGFSTNCYNIFTFLNFSIIFLIFNFIFNVVAHVRASSETSNRECSHTAFALFTSAPSDLAFFICIVVHLILSSAYIAVKTEGRTKKNNKGFFATGRNFFYQPLLFPTLVI